MIRRTIGLALFAGLSWGITESVIALLRINPSVIDGSDLLALGLTAGFLAFIVSLASNGQVKDVLSNTSSVGGVPKVTDYTFKNVHGGILVDKEGNTVAGVFDTGLSHKGDEAWTRFQSVATTYVANLIKGGQ
jgi:hypothetical protein